MYLHDGLELLSLKAAVNETKTLELAAMVGSRMEAPYFSSNISVCIQPERWLAQQRKYDMTSSVHLGIACRFHHQRFTSASRACVGGLRAENSGIHNNAQSRCATTRAGLIYTWSSIITWAEGWTHTCRAFMHSLRSWCKARCSFLPPASPDLCSLMVHTYTLELRHSEFEGKFRARF